MFVQEYYNTKLQNRLDPELAQDGHMQELRLLTTFQNQNQNTIVEMIEHLVQMIYQICFSSMWKMHEIKIRTFNIYWFIFTYHYSQEQLDIIGTID